jgi:hypothetical protein
MTREEADQKAAAHFAALREKGHLLEATGVESAVRLDELTGREPNVYGQRLEDCWIACVRMPCRGLHSNTILLIDDGTGALVYYGSANDEG